MGQATAPQIPEPIQQIQRLPAMEAHSSQTQSTELRGTCSEGQLACSWQVAEAQNGPSES